MESNIRHTQKYRYVYNFLLPKMQVCEVSPLNNLQRGRNLEVFDVGANQGLWTKAFLDSYGDRVKQIHLFEPLPGNLAILEERIKDGFITMKEKINITKSVVSSDSKDIEINFEKADSVLASIGLKNSLFGTNKVNLSNSLMVKSTTINDYMTQKNIKIIDILKIDTEGHELEILKSIQNLIKEQRVKTITFEFGIHQNRLRQNFQDFWDLFKNNGYKIYYFRGGKNGFDKLEIEEYSTKYEDFTRCFVYCASIY